jgi:hypothetical protein
VAGGGPLGGGWSLLDLFQRPPKPGRLKRGPAPQTRMQVPLGGYVNVPLGGYGKVPLGGYDISASVSVTTSAPMREMRPPLAAEGVRAGVFSQRQR